MLLTFRPESLEKIRRGREITTIRRNPGRWVDWYVNPTQTEDGYSPAYLRGQPQERRPLGRRTSCTNLYTTRGSVT